MAPTRSIKCMSRPPRRLPRILASLGRISSVISERDSLTLRESRAWLPTFILFLSVEAWRETLEQSPIESLLAVLYLACCLQVWPIALWKANVLAARADAPNGALVVAHAPRPRRC